MTDGTEGISLHSSVLFMLASSVCRLAVVWFRLNCIGFIIQSWAELVRGDGSRYRCENDVENPTADTKNS